MKCVDGGMSEESDSDNKAAFLIDFFRDCYGNYSSTSTQCPFCPLGLDCEEAKVTSDESGSNSAVGTAGYNEPSAVGQNASSITTKGRPSKSL